MPDSNTGRRPDDLGLEAGNAAVAWIIRAAWLASWPAIWLYILADILAGALMGLGRFVISLFVAVFRTPMLAAKMARLRAEVSVAQYRTKKMVEHL